MTPKQQQFVLEYLIDLNATQAAIRAGYSADTAYSSGQRLLKDVEVAAAIQSEMDKRAEKAGVDAEYVLRQAVKLHERCMQELEPFTDRKGNHVTDEHGRPLYVFDASGAARALELVGKHVKIQAFKERIEVGVNDELAKRMQEARERAGS